jgi:hypothetical protein
MIDINIVKDKYANMHDGEIIELASDSSSLTHEAFLLLKREFKRRNLDKDIISASEESRIETKKEKIRENISTGRKEFAKEIWLCALNAKYKDLTDEEIQIQLIEKGLSYDQSRQVTGQLEEVVKELLTNVNDGILYSALWFFGGLAVTVFTLMGIGKWRTLFYCLGCNDIWWYPAFYRD